MSEKELYNLITKALIYYDTQNKTFKKYIKSTNIKFNREEGTITFKDNDKDNIFKHDILGMFDNTTGIWMWAWMIPEFTDKETTIVKKLLYYGLKINTADNNMRKIVEDKLYLKIQLVNSRFLLDSNFQLELHLAIASYLIKDNIKFIYPRIKYLNEEKTKFITIYYLIY